MEYWDELFTEQAGTTSEWLVSYHSLKRHLAPYLKCSDDMLVVGCGNSDLSLGLYDDGFQVRALSPPCPPRVGGRLV